ncbi:MAG: hypothetical protein NTX86_03155 [Candidatus Dependentiae bacterium]|nr:hypothetical protein [Candidatus Dependentiae bacterium]
MKSGAILISISLSALALSSAFFWSKHLFWLVFIFLVPLFYSILKKPKIVGFTYGLWWGLLFFGTHCYGIVRLILEKGHGPFRIFLGIFFVIYCALHAGLWFWGAQRLARVRAQSINWMALCWLITTMAYFYWVRHGILWPLGSYMGYCAGSPLLVLAEYSMLLQALPIIGEYGLLFALCVMQMSIVLAYIKKSWWHAGLAIMCLVPFFMGLWQSSLYDGTSYVSTLGYVAPPSRSDTLEDQAAYVNEAIYQKLANKPSVTTIIMPETSFLAPLNYHTWIGHSWAEHDVTIAVGSARVIENDEGVQNFTSYFIIKHGRIVQWYDKKNLCPFTEFIPSIFKKFSCCRALFLNECNDYCVSEQSDRLELSPTLTAVPRLCSDIFIGNDHMRNEQEDLPLLVAINDTWFSAVYMRRLMYLFAIFESVRLQRDTIFASHSTGFWISRVGRLITL